MSRPVTTTDWVTDLQRRWTVEDPAAVVFDDGDVAVFDRAASESASVLFLVSFFLLCYIL